MTNYEKAVERVPRLREALAFLECPDPIDWHVLDAGQKIYIEFQIKGFPKGLKNETLPVWHALQNCVDNGADDYFVYLPIEFVGDRTAGYSSKRIFGLPKGKDIDIKLASPGDYYSIIVRGFGKDIDVMIDVLKKCFSTGHLVDILDTILANEIHDLQEKAFKEFKMAVGLINHCWAARLGG